MFRIKRKLKELSDKGGLIRVGIIGCGKMGNGLISQMSRIDGMKPSIVVDRHVDKSVKALLSSGVKREDIIVTNRIKEAELAVEKGNYVVSEDASLTYRLAQVAAIVESTGNPAFGANLAVEAIDHHKDMIMLNVECDAVVGPNLYDRAKKAGVVYTGSAGDEPGAIIELADFAMSSGFDLLCVGKGKNNPLDHYITADQLTEKAAKNGLNPHMLTSFTDGTNTMIELTSVANALGFVPDIPGGHGITTDPSRCAKDFSLIEQGGVLHQYGVVDFAFGMAPGVFAIVTSKAKEVQGLMVYLGMGDGPNYLLYRPYHLTSLETPITIFHAVVNREATMVPEMGQVTDTVAIAKRDLKAGEILQGIGGDMAFGRMITNEVQRADNLLPIALITDRTKVLVDVAKDTPITYDMVQLDESETITQLRREQDLWG